MLLEAARYLSEVKPLNRTIHFIFQPGEEGGAGAKTMMEDGHREMAVYRRHRNKAGHIGVRADPVTAGSDHQDRLPK